jgi:hypothetical protein
LSHARTIDLHGAAASAASADHAAPRPAGAHGLAAPISLALEGQVQNALNLFLPLKSPAQWPALQRVLTEAMPEVQEALRSLQYVHFARFLPAPDYSALWTITTYDGGLNAYTMDFVAVLGDVFTAVLRFIHGAPALPVQRHPREFMAFVRSHNVPVGVWSAYPDLTVLEIQRGAGR